MEKRNGKRIAVRLLMLTLVVLGAALLSGCTGSLYEDKIASVQGLNGPALQITWGWVAIAAIVAGLLGPVVTIVVIAVLRPYIFPPYYKVSGDDINLEIWVSERKYPLMAFPDLLVVPVAPDLKMVFGAAKIARDLGANTVQYEAEQIAPLQPGQAFVGAGAKYRWHLTGLAVIFDTAKRIQSEWLTASLRSALEQAEAQGADSAMIPDMTENLLAQPNWITEEQKGQTAHATARLLLESILACRGTIRTIKIWVFDTANADIYVEELERMEDAGLLGDPHTIPPDRAAHSSHPTEAA